MAAVTRRRLLARLRREKAELVKQHAKERAAWEKERAELRLRLSAYHP